MLLSEIRPRLRDPVEDRSDGSLWAFCPSHDDGQKQGRRSLHISPGNSGKPLIHCFAGCAYADIMRAIQGDSGPREQRESSAGGYQKRETVFKYTDKDGNLQYEVVRIDGQGGKTFRQRRSDGNGGWTWNTRGVARVPFRLPEVIQAIQAVETIFIMEGEKCVEALRSIGLVATCNDGGAGKWKQDHSKHLKGADVIILPDNDRPGKDHAEAVARSLVGIAKRIRVVDLPELPDKGDIVDWMAAGHGKNELLSIVERTAEWKGADPKTPERKHSFNLEQGSVILEGEDEETSYLWDGRLPQGGMSLLVAKPKIGKTTLAVNLAVRASRGEPFLGWDTLPCPVVFLALEESRREVRKTLRALGVTDEPLLFHFGLAPRDAMQEVDPLVTETGAGLLIIDTLQKFARVRDLNDYASVTTALEPLLAIARTRNCHVLLTHHAVKADRADGDEILGSTALLGAVDTAIILKKRAQGRTISTIQRYGESISEIVMTLEDGYSLSIGGSLAEAKRGELLQAIEKVLIGQPGLTREQLFEEVEGRRSDIISAIQWAIRQEPPLLKREGQGKRKDPYRFFPFPRSHIYMGNGGTETENGVKSTYSLDNFRSQNVSRSGDSGTESGTEKQPRERNHGDDPELWEATV